MSYIIHIIMLYLCIELSVTVKFAGSQRFLRGSTSAVRQNITIFTMSQNGLSCSSGCQPFTSVAESPPLLISCFQTPHCLTACWYSIILLHFAPLITRVTAGRAAISTINLAVRNVSFVFDRCKI